MKKIVLAMIATAMMATSAMAQDNENKERQQPTKEQMAQHRTDNMAKKYGLNEEQTAKLLDLNKKYTDMMPRRGGARHGRPDGNRMKQAPRESNEMKKPTAEEMKDRKARFEEMRKKMEEYDTQLQTILTPEQFKSYKADMEKMRQRGPRNGNRPTQKE